VVDREAVQHMKTVEILYQAFRVRYSLNQLQLLLDRGCRIALLGPGDAVSTLKGYFGDPVHQLGGGDPSEDLVELSWELGESALKELRTCDACLVLFPDGPPEVETLQELAEKVPIHVKTLWLCLIDQPKGGTYHEKDLTLPTVQALPREQARQRFIKLLIAALPQVVVILARNWTSVRSTFCRTLTRRTSLRNGVRAGLSSLPLRSVPVIGPVLSMLATSAETMMLTSSQLRLSFVIAAAHNRPLDFFDRISELWPIIGSAYGFRGLSRGLVKKVPAFAPGLKASIAFSGTYAIGEASRLYYEHGQPTSDEVRRELVRRSHEEGAKEAQRLFRKVLAGQSLESLEDDDEGGEVADLVDRLTQPGNGTIDLGDLDKRDEESSEALEPTVEMDAIVVSDDEESASKGQAETKPSPAESRKPKAEPESETSVPKAKAKASRRSKKKKKSTKAEKSSPKSGSGKKAASKKRAKPKAKRKKKEEN
jgi:hypothetical protein